MLHNGKTYYLVKGTGPHECDGCAFDPKTCTNEFEAMDCVEHMDKVWKEQLELPL